MISALRVCRLHSAVRSYSSALYVTGQKASETFAFLTPHFDCKSRFENVTKLQENIDARGLSINAEKLKESWQFLQSVQATKQQLETHRDETAKKIKHLMKSDENDSQIKPLKILGKKIKENLKMISKEIWDLEETVMLRFLQLPNDLHPDTPTDSDVIVAENGVRASSQSESHMEIAQQLGLLKYINPACYYLENEAAEFEIALIQHVASVMNGKQFILTSNPDFSKSLIVEGCGQVHTDANSVFILQANDGDFNPDACLHLVGGSSLATFSAFFAKHETKLSDQPVKLCSIGRHYSPPSVNSTKSLFDVSQSTTAELFIAGPNCETQTMQSVDSALEVLQGLYKDLDLHFRVVRCNARQLQAWESLRFSLQMFSCHSQSYVEVANVSHCGTYLSKRLLMKYRDSHKQDFLSVVVARAVSVPKLLACLLEEKIPLSSVVKL